MPPLLGYLDFSIICAVLLLQTFRTDLAPYIMYVWLAGTLWTFVPPVVGFFVGLAHWVGIL